MKKRITLDEMKDKTHGPVGTPRRDALEESIKEQIGKKKRKQPTS